MPYNFDIFGHIEKPHVYLCNVDKSYIGELIAIDLSPTIKWNTYNEVSFKVPRMYNDIITGETFVNPYYDRVESLRLVCIDTLGFFEMESIEFEYDGLSEYKSVTAHSYEVILGQKFLNRFKINTGDNDDYAVGLGAEASEMPEPVYTYIPDVTKKSHSLLDVVLAQKHVNWNIGHVDPVFAEAKKIRKYDVDGESVYDFLTDTVANTVKGVFEFDTFTNTINLYEEETVSQDTDIFIDKENLLKNVSVDYDVNDIKTNLRVNGSSDNAAIRRINLGGDYITDLSFYATEEYMGKTLSEKYKQYVADMDTYRQQYDVNARLIFDEEKNNTNIRNYLKHWEGIRDTLNELYNAAIDETTAWNSEEEKKRYLDALAKGDGSEVNTNYYRYLQIYYTLMCTGANTIYTRPVNPDGEQDQRATEIQTAINSTSFPRKYYTLDDALMYPVFGEKQHATPTIDSTFKNYENGEGLCVEDMLIYLQTAVDESEEELKRLYSNQNDLQEDASLDKHFELYELETLRLFLREDSYDDSNFVYEDNDTEDIRQSTEQQLLDTAMKELAKISQPQLSFSMSMANIYAIPEFKDYAKLFKVGNYITVGIRDDYYVHVIITEISFNYDNPSDFKVNFSNAYNSKSVVDIHAELLKQTKTVANKVASGASFWQKSSETTNEIMDALHAGLQGAVGEIKLSDNQDVTMDKYGLHIRKKATDAGELQTADGYLLKQAWITNEKFLYTDDGWKTSRSAFGTVKFNDTEYYGLIADIVSAGQVIGSTVIGGDIIGTTISNGNGFSVDKDGNLKATAGEIASFKISGDTLYTQAKLNGQQVQQYGVGIGSTTAHYAFWAGESVVTDNESNKSTYNKYGTYITKPAFYVNQAGFLYAANAEIHGNLVSNSGTIGGFEIGSNSIHTTGKDTFNSDAAGVYIGTDGIKLGSTFSVSRSGTLTATGGEMRNIQCDNLSVYGSFMNNTVIGAGSTYSGEKVASQFLADMLSSKQFAGCSIPRGFSLIVGNADNGNITTLPTGGLVLSSGDGVGVSIDTSLSVRGNIISSGTGIQASNASLLVKSLTVIGGEKNRAVETKDYGVLKLAATESAIPTFTDYGVGTLNDEGECYIYLDPRFLQTVEIDNGWVAFLTKYGDGDVYIDKANSGKDFFVVKGTPLLSFSWEVKCVQQGNINNRLERYEQEEQEPDYGLNGCLYIDAYERSINNVL